MKSIIYIKLFIKIYNWHSRKIVYQIYRIVQFEKYLILKIKNSFNLGCQQFYKIYKIL